MKRKPIMLAEGVPLIYVLVLVVTGMGLSGGVAYAYPVLNVNHSALILSTTSPYADDISFSAFGSSDTIKRFLELASESGFSSTVANNDGVNLCCSETNRNLDVLSVSAVPLPAAVWLFGSTMIGMGFIGRRKRTDPKA